jgi:hypothetical protein
MKGPVVSLIALCRYSINIAAFVVFLLGSVNGYAQSNIRYKSVALNTDTLKLDSLSVVPGTLAIKNADGLLIDTNDYTLYSFQSLLIWKKKPALDSVKVFFRVFPFALAGESYNKNFEAYRQNSINQLAKPFIYRPVDERGFFIDFGGLDYNGSFSRSVGFGTNQDVVLNSLFNLQLSGMLGNDVEVSAAITDNNIPIQPEGNTQQIQEFDKIFIQIRKDRQRVLVGDYDLFNPQRDYFMRFSKKYQGAYYTGAFDIKKAGTFKTGAAGGISRGKFSRNTLTVSEGNQGPYKLTGSNGETFLVVLANTEEVFVNGVKMERGADRDYVIDYNLGEITFMPRRIITKDLRVVVEFEYSERNYLRTAAFLNTEFESKKADVHFNVYSEQDSKGQNVQQDLNQDKKTFLTTIGDSLQNAFYRGWDSVGFDPNRVLYQMKDTAVFPFTFPGIFVYSTDPANAKYAVTFSFVGEGKGNYVPATSTANGRVYQWVLPIIDSVNLTAKPAGSYEPVILLVTPKYQQMYTLGGEVRPDKNNTIIAEAAMSNLDLNMYSKQDQQDNLGFAARGGYKGNFVTKYDSAQKQKQQLTIDLNYEFLQNRFNTIERYRNIEFGRDWNLATAQQRYDEHLAISNLTYQWLGLGNINYRFKTFIQTGNYQGFENGLNGVFSKNGFNLVFQNSYLRSSSPTITTNYIRPKADFYYSSAKTKGWKIGALYDHEINMIKDLAGDSLTRNSFLWQNYKVYAATPDSATNKFSIEYVMRYEHRPNKRSFNEPFFGAQTVNFSGQVNSLKNQTLNFNLTYRHAKDGDSLNSQQPENFYLGRVDYNLSLLKGAIRSTTLYEIGSGREQKTQLNFQRSLTNQGEYIWLGDLNENGVKDINEFQLRGSLIDSASYIRVFVVTPEFVAVNTSQLNQVLQINPAAVWKSKKGIRKVLSMFNILASVQIIKKTYADRNKKIGNYFNPFPLSSETQQLVSTTFNSRNSLYFNRLDPKYGAQIDFNYVKNRTLLTTGFENRILQSQGITARWNIVKTLNIQTSYTNGLKANESDFFKTLQYRYTFNDAFADLSYQFKTTLRLSARYDFSIKKNPTDSVGVQQAQIHKATLNARYNRLGKTSVDATVAYASIVYNDKGYVNAQLEFAMLEGLRNGNNLVWTLAFEQNLTANIQLAITYDGRMTGFTPGVKETLKAVHTGRAEIRAVF